MQRPFSCVPATLTAIEATISPARLARYLPEAKGNKHLAIRLYVWNARLCEAFYLPTQLAEVAARNAIHKPVERRFTAKWYDVVGFKALLPPRLEAELRKVVADERWARRAAFSANHVIAGLSFGFWLNLLTTSYEKHFWATGLQKSFPHLPGAIDQEELYKRLDRLRNWRNKIAHHYAIFDRHPKDELANTSEIISWICPETHWFANELSTVQNVLSRKPRI
jgi:hypothetical protein